MDQHDSKEVLSPQEINAVTLPKAASQEEIAARLRDGWCLIDYANLLRSPAMRDRKTITTGLVRFLREPEPRGREHGQYLEGVRLPDFPGAPCAECAWSDLQVLNWERALEALHLDPQRLPRSCKGHHQLLLELRQDPQLVWITHGCQFGCEANRLPPGALADVTDRVAVIGWSALTGHYGGITLFRTSSTGLGSAVVQYSYGRRLRPKRYGSAQ
ncbi:MAG: hypothetical protein ACO1SX_19720 [Actinomycetota bacterium]